MLCIELRFGIIGNFKKSGIFWSILTQKPIIKNGRLTSPRRFNAFQSRFFNPMHFFHLLRHSNTKLSFCTTPHRKHARTCVLLRNAHHWPISVSRPTASWPTAGRKWPALVCWLVTMLITDSCTCAYARARRCRGPCYAAPWPLIRKRAVFDWPLIEHLWPLAPTTFINQNTNHRPIISEEISQLSFLFW